MHVYVAVIVIDTLVSGALGYLYGAKVQKAAQAEVAKVESQAKTAVTKEVSKL